MSLWLFALGILALLLEPRPSCSITHNAQVDAYVKKLIVEFKTDPQSRRYDNVILPPRFGDGYQDFLLPKVFIWCPMHHYGLDILCPLHKLPLKAGFFTDELQRKGPRNPRLVYDLRGNVLLIQRLYICPQEGMKHKYFSASLSIIENIPKLYGLCCFPFVMFHKSSCTKQLVDFVETQIFQGVNFLAICEGIAGLNFKEFSERMACFSIYQDSNSHINKTKMDYDNFYSDSMYAFPGDKKVMELFLGNFVHKKSYYDAEMEKTARSSKIITCDHTFKVSKYICASRGSDNKYVKQFENLFIVLNEDHKVVGWRLTKSTEFEDIRDLLQEIQYSLDNPLKTVIVDDCCKVKRQYESIFPGIVVKLDLFHATQRVIKTFPKGSEWSKQISSEFGLVFREDGDCGATRCLTTPEPEVIERNLDNFIKKWKHTLNENIQTKTFRELENLRIHVKKGCISGIEPGQGTECNERLHQTLNKSLLCGATKIGPEIAIAVITLIFYALNCRREGKKHEGNSRIIPFVPLPSVKAVKVAEELEEQKLRTAHLNCGAVGDDIQLDNVWRNCEIDTSTFEGLSANAIFMLENVEDMCNDTLTALLMKNTKTMLDMLNEINNQCNDRSFNAYDLPVKQSVGDDHVLASDADTDPSSEQDHNSLLIRNLSSFNLEIDPVEGDGDCAFRSIIKEMRKTLEWNDANGKLTDHLKDMGLAGAAIDDDVFTLCQLFVNNVQSNEYYQMLLGISEEELNAETERFREQGTFSGEVGDLVMKVCSDILQIPILVITSMPRHSCVPFIPDEMVVTSTLYVAFNAFGPCHYDGTRPTTLQEKDIELSPNTKGKGCSCGKNNTDNRSSCLPGSRCPCIHKERSCDRDCRCKSCANKATISGRSTRIPADLSCRCGEDSVKSDPKFVACVDGRRRSRCPCLKANQGCNIACACKNCGNPNGENKKSVISPVKRKTKRESASPYKRVRSADYLTSVNVEPNQKLWTVYEQCLLMTAASFLASTLVSPSVDNVVRLFNHIANSSICKESKFPIRAKNNLQIAGKLRQLEKKKNVLK